MVKRFWHIISLIMISCLSIVSVAFADVPNPYGRPKGPLPPPPEQFWIYREAEFYNKDMENFTIEIYYKAPMGCDVEYTVKDDKGNLILKNVVTNEEENGQFSLVLEKPAPRKIRFYNLEAQCYKAMVKTPFGLKRMEKREYFASLNQIYTVTAKENGDLEIER